MDIAMPLIISTLALIAALLLSYYKGIAAHRNNINPLLNQYREYVESLNNEIYAKNTLIEEQKKLIGALKNQAEVSNKLIETYRGPIG